MKRTFCRLWNDYPNILLIGIIFSLTFLGILTFVVHYTQDIATNNWQVNQEEANGWHFFSYIDDQPVDLFYENGYLVVDPTVETIYQQRKIDEEIDSATLLFEFDSNLDQIFLDNQLLYTNHSAAYKTPSPYLITLPQENLGKTITVSFFNHDATQVKPIKIELLSYLDFIADTIDYTLIRLVPIACFFLISIFLLIMFLYRLVLKSFDPSTLLLSMTAMLFMLFLATSYFEIFLIESNQRYLKYLFYILYPLPLSFFFYTKMQYSRKIYLPVILTHALIAGTVLLLHALNLATPITVILYSMLAAFVSLYTFTMMFNEARHKNRFFLISLKILAISLFSIFCFFCLIHFFNYPFSVELFHQVILLYDDLQLRYLKDTVSLLFMIIVFMVSLFDYLTLVIRRNVTLQALTMKNEVALKSYQLMENNILKTRALKHDLKHHIAVLKAYSQSRDYEKLDAYLLSLTNDLQLLPTIRYTDNFLVNAILTTRLEEAKNADINVEHEIYLEAEIAIEETDLCSFLMNMLDNAIEANQQIHHDTERWIKIKIHQKNSFLIISCQNAFCIPVNFSDNHYVSSKEDKKNHGFGIKTMEIIAEKYHSVLSIHYHDDIFTLKTNLKIPEIRK